MAAASFGSTADARSTEALLGRGARADAALSGVVQALMMMMEVRGCVRIERQLGRSIIAAFGSQPHTKRT